MARRREGKRKEKTDPSGKAQQEESERKQGLTRRDFIIRAGEAAAFALFGVTALDPIIEKVLARLESWESTSRMGRRVQQKLIESGLGGKAWADSCPPSPVACSPFQWYCKTTGSIVDSHTCSAAQTPTDPYRCLTTFWCEDIQSSFDCDIQGPDDAWFGCGVDPEPGGHFRCKPPEGQAGAGFRCAADGPATDFHCSNLVQCERPTIQSEFRCGGATWDPFFDCGIDPTKPHYRCKEDGSEPRFSCPPVGDSERFVCEFNKAYTGSIAEPTPGEIPPPPQPPPEG